MFGPFNSISWILSMMLCCVYLLFLPHALNSQPQKVLHNDAKAPHQSLYIEGPEKKFILINFFSN